MLASDIKKLTIGRYGEQLNAELLQNQGHSVQLSEDQYDTEKDMIVDGVTTEVKTGVPIMRGKYANHFHINVSQSAKLDDVGRLFMNAVYKDAVCVYENLDRSEYKIQTWPDNSKSRVYDLSKQKLHAIITRADIVESFVKNNVSNYIHNCPLLAPNKMFGELV